MENRVDKIFRRSLQPLEQEAHVLKGHPDQRVDLSEASHDTVTLSRKGSQKKDSFSVGAAAKHFFKGVLSPFVTMIKHPLMTVGALAATFTVASFAPVTLPLMVLGGLGYGAYQGSKGVLSALSNYRAGNYDAAEKAFAHIGEGAFAAGTSALGVRSAGAIAAEAKVTTTALKSATTSADKLKAVEAGIDAGIAVRQGGWFGALKENVSLVTSRGGVRAAWSQLNPRFVLSNLHARGKEVVRMFKEPPVADVDKALRSAQKHLGIADKDMPTLVKNLEMVDPATGKKVDLSGIVAGFYQPKTHQLQVQPNGFQYISDSLKPKTLMDRMFSPDLSSHLEKFPGPIKNFIGNLALKKHPLEALIAHELTHARQGLKIQQLTRGQAETVLKNMGVAEPTEVGRILDQFRFAEGGGRSLNGAALNEANDALSGFVKALQGNVEALKNKNWRPYITAPAEVEARLEAAKFNIGQSLEQVGQNSARGAKALKNVRTGVVESRVNEGFSKINQLQAAGGTAEQIQAQENLIQVHRGVFGTHSATSQLQSLEDTNNRSVAIEKWLNKFNKAKPSSPPA